MYVLKRNAKPCGTGATIPKGTALFSVFANVRGGLATARLAGGIPWRT